jgi:putative ABC transport system permease protein
MLKNYFKITIRNLLHHKIYSFINIFGLAIGIACCLLILLYIQDELSFDSFHEKANRIYRVNTDLKFGTTELALPLCSDMLGPIMKKDYPQIEEYTRIYSYNNPKMIRQGNNFITEHGIAYADSTFFKVFTFPVISGNTSHILNEPNTVVITESIAEKYFGTNNVLGRFIETDDDGNRLFKVAAVIKDMPVNSHFRFSFIFPMHNLNYNWGNLVSFNFRTYLLLKKGTDYKEFEKNFVTFNDKYAFPFAQRFMNIKSKSDFIKAGNRLEHTLIPLRDIHLYSKRTQEISPTGTIEYVYIFGVIALFILIVACVNFMNLTTARSANRAREVGLRKVLGTQRTNLISQFLFESIIMTSISVVLASLIVSFILPAFNELAGKEMMVRDIFSYPCLIILIMLPFIIGISAGSYPAFFLSRFLPVEILKGKLSTGSKSGMVRSALVVFQFATSIILITGTIIIYNQLNYIQNKNLGYQKDQLLIINGAYSLNNIDAFHDEMMKVPGISSATISGFLPVPSSRSFNVFFTTPSMGAENGLTMQQWMIDYEYMKTLGIELKSGRNFSENFGNDSSSVILNETAVKKLGLSQPLNSKLYSFNQNKHVSYNVIGIAKDFNYESLRQNIGPLCFVFGKNVGNITFRINAANIPDILSKAESLWKNMVPGIPFSIRFLDESFNEVYKTERRIGLIALIFSLLAIIVASLGLFGLSTFLAEQRTKEIGVRKVLGAPFTSLLFLLLKEFLKWIVIANIIAWPIAYFIMEKWLQDFAYRIDINLSIFILSGVIALIIALITVCFQTIKAAIANPIDSLRYE